MNNFISPSSDAPEYADPVYFTGVQEWNKDRGVWMTIERERAKGYDWAVEWLNNASNVDAAEFEAGKYRKVIWTGVRSDDDWDYEVEETKEFTIQLEVKWA